MDRGPKLMQTKVKNILGFTLVFMLLTGAALAKSAAKSERSGEAVGTLITIQGSVVIVHKGKEYKGNQINKGDLVYAGDVIKTLELARAQILLNDGSFIRLNHNTTLELKQKGKKKKTNRLKVLFGNLWAKVKKKDSGLEIETPSAVAAIKGTELEVEVLKKLARLLVWNGLVLWHNDQGSQNVGAGYRSQAEPGQAPTEPEQVDLDQLDQWFLGVLDASSAKTLKTRVRDKDGKEYNINLKYQKK